MDIPKNKINFKYEQHHMKLCNIKNFIINYKISSEKNINLLNLDKNINNNSFEIFLKIMKLNQK